VPVVLSFQWSDGSHCLYLGFVQTLHCDCTIELQRVFCFRFNIIAIVCFANTLTGKMYVRCDGASLVLMGLVGFACYAVWKWACLKALYRVAQRNGKI
jgi:hypothetical protein